MRAFLLASALSLVAASAAVAGEPGSLLTVQGRSGDTRIVSAAGLALGSAEGRAALQRRVGFAIADLCDPRRFSAAEPADSLKCTAETWASVQPRLDAMSPRLASR